MLFVCIGWRELTIYPNFSSLTLILNIMNTLSDGQIELLKKALKVNGIGFYLQCCAKIAIANSCTVEQVQSQFYLIAV
jgi:hypothetical protein